MTVKTRLAKSLMRIAVHLDPGAVLDAAMEHTYNLEDVDSLACGDSPMLASAGCGCNCAPCAHADVPASTTQHQTTIDALERELFAFAALSWINAAQPQAQAAAVPLIRRHHPGLAEQMPKLAERIKQFAATLQEDIRRDQAEFAAEQSNAPEAAESSGATA